MPPYFAFQVVRLLANPVLPAEFAGR